MPPYLPENGHGSSESRRMEYEALAGKVYKRLGKLVDGAPDERVAFVKSGMAKDVLRIERVQSKASPHVQFIEVYEHSGLDEDHDKQAPIFKAYSRNVFDQDHVWLDVEDVERILADLEPISDIDGQTDYVSPEELVSL